RPPDLGSSAAADQLPPEVAARPALEARDGAAEVPDVVGVAARRDRQHPFRVAYGRQRVVPAREDARVVDDLDGVEGEIRNEPTQRAVTQRTTADGVEGMGRHGQPSLGVDQLDRPLRGQAWWYPLLEEEAEEVAVACADLFADDHLDAERGMLGGERARLERAADLVVVGDGDDVRPAGRRLDDHVGMLSAVAPDGMDVEIGAARKRR